MNAESIKEVGRRRTAPQSRQARCLIVTPDTQFGQRLARVLEMVGCDSYAVLETVLDDTSFDADCVFFDRDDIFNVDSFISVFPPGVRFIPFRDCGNKDGVSEKQIGLDKNWSESRLLEETRKQYRQLLRAAVQLQH